MDFLNNLPIDQIGLTVGMVVIVFLFAAITVIKGIIKMILALISLTIAGVAFVAGYLYSPPIIQKFVPEAAGWMPLLAGGICALLALAIIQVVLGLFSGKKKADKVSGEAARSGGGRNPLAPLFGLVVGVLVLYGVLTGARFAGTKAELDYLKVLAKEGLEKAPPQPVFAKINTWLDKSPVATFHERIDPFYDRARVNLAKLMVLSENSQVLARALKDPANKEAMSQPEVKSICLLENTQRQLARAGKFAELFKNERFYRTANRPSIERELLEVDLGVLFEKKEEEDPKAKKK